MLELLVWLFSDYCVVFCVGGIVVIWDMVLSERLLNVGYYLFRLLVGYLVLF